MYVEQLNHQNDWYQFLQSSPNATFYHTPQWKQVLEHSFTKPLYLAVRDRKGSVVAMCPGFISDLGFMKMYHSTPCSDYAGPIISSDHFEQAAHLILKYLRSYCDKTAVAYGKMSLMEVDSKRIWRYATKYVEPNGGVVEIDLKTTSSDYIWNKVFSARMRRDLRQIEKKGFQVREATTLADFKEFYSLYVRNMRSVLGSPFSYKFMENMWNLLYPENMRIWLMGKENLVAGTAVFKYKRRTYGAYVGLDKEGCGRYSVIPYLIWHEIKKAEEDDCELVSLGSTPNGPGEVYYLQKMKMGGSFSNQITMWVPFTSNGHLVVLGRDRMSNVWRSFRVFLPQSFKRRLEQRLSLF